MKASEARRIALAFPDAHEEPHFEFDSFRVKGRIFATLPPDGQHLHLFVDDAARESALALHPDCLEKLWWGKKVAGLRADLVRADREVIRGLLENAWKKKAGKRAVAAYEKGTAA